MIERQIDQHINEMAMRMSYQGLKLDDFLKYTGQTMEQLRGLCREREEAGSGGGCARRHPYRGKPDAMEEEVDAEIAKYAESAEKSAEDIKKTLSDSDMEYFKELVKTQKAIDLIVNNSVEEEEAKA